MNTNLKISNVTKIYPGCVANDNVSLEFNSGKIYALLGENGAGKSSETLSFAIHPGYILVTFEILRFVFID